MEGQKAWCGVGFEVRVREEAEAGEVLVLWCRGGGDGGVRKGGVV